jgi:hypothetical protein
MYNNNKLTEGLRANDLEGFIDKLFTVDQYKSKMGADEDIVVLAFRCKDKLPAIDLMEFIEKGYTFVLDADVSAGEEHDGQHSVFVELQRNKKVPAQIQQMLNGISLLCGINNWRFRYYKQIKSHEYTEQAAEEIIPLNTQDYYNVLRGIKSKEIEAFLNKGSLDSVQLTDDYNIKIQKPYAEPIIAKFIDHGNYENIKESVNGAVKLDSESVSQTLYLEKYLGNYEILKIDNKFLIKNGDQALIIQKDNW